MTREQIDAALKVAESRIDAAKSAQTVSAPDPLPGWWSVQSAMTISSAVLLFGLLVIALAGYLIRTGSNAEAVLRIFGTVLILIMAVFLVVAGYSDTQIAPVMGLLGTVAGYLLGKEVKPGNGADGPAPQQQ